MGFSPHRLGMSRLNTISAWDRPMVATVSMRRGERAKRRTIRISTTAASTTTADHPGGQPHEVVDPGETDEADGQDRRSATQVTLGEVDHPVQAVDQAEPDGHQRAEQTEDHSLHPHADRHGEQDELGDDHRGDGRRSPWPLRAPVRRQIL